jgi:hypothetical protein
MSFMAITADAHPLQGVRAEHCAAVASGAAEREEAARHAAHNASILEKLQEQLDSTSKRVHHLQITLAQRESDLVEARRAADMQQQVRLSFTVRAPFMSVQQ